MPDVPLSVRALVSLHVYADAPELERATRREPVTSSIIPPGATYEVTEPEYIGKMSARVELFSEPARPPCAPPIATYSSTVYENGDIEVTRHPPEWPGEPEETRAQIQVLLQELQLVSEDVTCTARLHPVECMMLADVLRENRHLRCVGCLKWMTALAKKARGEEWKA